MLNRVRRLRLGVLRTVGLVALVALLVGTVVALATQHDDGESETDPMAGVIGDGARAVIAAGAVAPAERPPYLSLVMPIVQLSDDGRHSVLGTETSYQAGALNVMVCDYGARDAAASQSSCAIEQRQLIRDEAVGDRWVQVAVDADWNVPARAADVPAGDRIAQILAWWTSVPLSGRTPPGSRKQPRCPDQACSGDLPDGGSGLRDGGSQPVGERGGGPADEAAQVVGDVGE